MANKFKTPQLYNFLNHIKKLFPNKISIINRYIPYWTDLDLSKSNHNQLQKTYQQTLTLATNETVYLVWNIGDIIHYINIKKLLPYSVRVQDILSCAHMNKANWLEIYNHVKKNQYKVFLHESDYIIISGLPLFSGLSIIDGNHRFFEASHFYTEVALVIMTSPFIFCL